MADPYKLRSCYLGADNGVSGSLGLLQIDQPARFARTPIRNERAYTKDEKFINRVDVPELRFLLAGWHPADDTLVLLERPMVNPTRLNASLSAVRALEATLIVIEENGWHIRYIDSKEWQSVELSGIVGSTELKKASLTRGRLLYPDCSFKSDADSLLMARWAQQAGL